MFSIIVVFVKSLIIGAAPVEPSVEDLAYDDEHNYGQYPAAWEIHEWDVDWYVERLRTPLPILVLWKYVATRKHVPRWIRSRAWTIVHPHFSY